MRTRLAATALLVLFFALVLPMPTRAATPPLKTISRYMSTVDHTTLYDLGCDQGTRAFTTHTPQNLVVVLDFGTPAKFTDGSWGALLWGAPNQKIAAIREAVKWYAIGYHQCSAEDNSTVVRIAVGTNNSGGAVAAAGAADAHGRAWGTMINDLQAWVATRSEGQDVSFAGANDIEPGFSEPKVATDWVKGYDAVTNWPMYNFGAADGCSSLQVTGNECGTSGHSSWVAEDIYFVSWGASPAWPLPEIYVYPPPKSPVQAKQWYWLAKYGLAKHATHMHFKAAFTEHAADPGTNTAAQGWQQLTDAINADPATSGSVDWSTDVTWDN